MALVPLVAPAVTKLGETALEAVGMTAGASSGISSAAVTVACATLSAGYALGASCAKRRRVQKELVDVKEQNAKLQNEMATVHGQVQQVERQMDEMRRQMCGVQHAVGAVQGHVDGMQHQVGGMQGLVQGVSGDVAQVRGQLSSVEKVAGKVESLRESVGETRGKVEQCWLEAEQSAKSVQRMRGDTNQLAVRMGQSVRQALNQGFGAVVGNVNHALEQRSFGRGPQVRAVEVAVVPDSNSLALPSDSRPPALLALPAIAELVAVLGPPGPPTSAELFSAGADA